MKRLIAVMMAAGFVLSASADILEQWTYDEAAGTQLHQTINSGSVGTSWNWGDPAKWLVDGNGNLDTLPPNTDYKTSQNFPAALGGSDTYTMKITLGAWDIPAAAADAQLKWRLRSSASSGTIMGIQSKMSSTGLKFTLISAGTNYRDYDAGGLTGSAATASIDFNVAAGTATYFVNGVEMESFSGLSFGSMELFGMNKEGDWSDAGRVFKIDEQVLSVVPEPATVSLFALVGAGLMAIRRLRAV